MHSEEATWPSPPRGCQVSVIPTTTGIHVLRNHNREEIVGLDQETKFLIPKGVEDAKQAP